MPTRRLGARGALLVLVLPGPLGVVGCGGPGAPSGAPASPGDATVVRVVDGDTLVADVAGEEERVRLIGIDTPETARDGTPAECFGDEASDHLDALLPPGTPVRLERDVEERDRYGRLLAYVHRHGDDLFVNLAMARDGFASPLTIPPNVAHTADVAAAAAESRAAGRGLWDRCPGTATWAPP